MFRPVRILTSITAVGLGFAGVTPAGAAPVLASNSPAITSLWLADAGADTLIAEITDGASFDSDSLPAELTIVAKTNHFTESVQFGNATELATHTENLEPYALNGDVNGDFAPADLHIGSNVLRATPYGADNASGTTGKEVLISFSLRPLTYRVDATADGHDAEPGDGICSTAPIDQFASRSGTSSTARETSLAAETGRVASRRTKATATSRCTLRAAIEETNAQAGWQHIEVPNMTDDYRVDLGVLEVTDPVKIEGVDVNTANSIWPAPTVNANGRSGAFYIHDASTVTLSWLQITGGDAEFDRGGGVSVSSSTVVIENSVISSNRGNIGGGVYAQQAILVVEGTTIRNNEAGHPDSAGGSGITQRGGGLALVDAGAIIEDSTIENNRAVRGGGIYLSNSTVQTVNVEIVANEANTRGGGLEFVASTGQLAFTTIADNVAGTSNLDGPQAQIGGGMVVDQSNVEIANSIVANNVGAFLPGDEYYSPDCYTLGADASIVSRRGNVVGILTDNCDFNDYEFDFVLTDSIGFDDSPLGPEFRFGTYSLDAGSPAVDNAVFVPGLAFFNCPASDLGGFTARPQGPACDSGAWERPAG